MNIFGNKTVTWWQVGLLKLSVGAFGVAVGAYWSDIFLPYLTPIIVIAIVSGLYIAYVWLIKQQ